MAAVASSVAKQPEARPEVAQQKPEGDIEAPPQGKQNAAEEHEDDSGVFSRLKSSAYTASRIYLETFQHPGMAVYGVGRLVFEFIMLWWWHPAIAATATLAKLCVYILPAVLHRYVSGKSKRTDRILDVVMNCARVYDLYLHFFATLGAALLMYSCYFLLRKCCALSDVWRTRLCVVAWIIGFEAVDQTMRWWPRGALPRIRHQFDTCRGQVTSLDAPRATFVADCALSSQEQEYRVVRILCSSDSTSSSSHCDAHYVAFAAGGDPSVALAEPTLGNDTLSLLPTQGFWRGISTMLSDGNSSDTQASLAEHVVNTLPSISSLQTSKHGLVREAAQALLDQFLGDRLVSQKMQQFLPRIDHQRIARASAALVVRTSPHALEPARTLRELQRVTSEMFGTSRELAQGVWSGLTTNSRVNVWPMPVGGGLHKAAIYANDSLAMHAGAYSGSSQASDPAGYCVYDAQNIGCYINERNILGLWTRDTAHGRPGLGPNSSVLVHEMGHLLERLLGDQPIAVAFPELQSMLTKAGLSGSLINSTTIAGLVSSAYKDLAEVNQATFKSVFPTDYAAVNDMEFFAELTTVATGTCDRCYYTSIDVLLAKLGDITADLPPYWITRAQVAWSTLHVVFDSWFARNTRIKHTNPICHPNRADWYNSWDLLVKLFNSKCPQ